MGGRGERPVLFLTSIAGAWLAGILAIPGVRRVFGGLQCAWDAAWAVARLSNLPEPPEPTAIGDLPGLGDYQKLQLHEKTRPYQKDAILFAARRAYAILAHPMRSGKTLIAIGTAIVIGSRRTLIVGPSITKWNWAEEVAVWAKESALVLDGRAGREGRSFCVTCRGKGRLADDSLCVDCRQRNGQSYGYRLHYVEMMEPEYEGPEDARYAPFPTTFRCARHKDQTTHRPYTLCPVCRQNFHRVIEDSRWVIINYDLLTPQEHELGGGQKILRADLDGWIRELTEYHAFDLGLCDEAHMLRGWSTSTDRAGYTRRERVRQLFRRVPRVLAITGTPFWGRVRDIWGILDVISNGLFGDPTRVPGKEFMLRYCLPSEAPIWMADMSHRPIEDVKKGDLVWGWTWPTTKNGRRQFQPVRVLETFSRVAQVVEVTLASGRKVRCTPDHMWANAKHNQPNIRYAPVQLGDVRRDALGRVHGRYHSTKLAHVTEVWPVGTTTSKSYKTGYLHGLIDGDGAISFGWHLRPSGVCPSAEIRRTVALRIKDVEAVDRAEAFGRDLGIVPTRPKPTKSDWHTLHFQGKEALAFFYAPRAPGNDDDYWRGFLAGIYDAEAWGAVFAQYRAVNPGTYDNIVDALHRFNFKVRLDAEAVTLCGGRHEFSRFWALVQPAIQRKALSGFRSTRDSETANGLSNWAGDDVVSIKPVGAMRVHCLRTETGNFVAYGYASKNCEGRAGSFGFEANGRSVYADTELVERLKRIMLKPSRAEIFSYLPPIMRRVIRLELPRARPFRLTGNRAQSLANAIKSVADQKRELILESLCDEIAEGNKIIVFCFHVDTATRWLKAFEEAFAERTQRRRMAEVRAKAWLVTSESPASPRAKLLSATQFREHDGAGVFIATIDSMSVGISLRGASSLHFVDLHWSPGALFQAEDRAWYPESAGVALNYYVGLRSVDEHVEQVVLPKVEHICRLTRDAQATAVMDAMQGPASAERTLEAIYERHVAHLREPAALHLDPDGE